MKEGEAVEQEQTITIYTLKLANYLIREGLDMVGVYDNAENSRYKVFLFPDTEKTKKLIDKYTTQQRKGAKKR
jgi:hypothetical protein